MDIFAEEFISHGGMDYLLAIIQQTSGNLAAYTLNALSIAMTYRNGLAYMTEQPSTVQTLFELMYSKNVNVVKQAVALVFVVCEFSEDGFFVVNQAIKSNAVERNKQPYEDLVLLLDNGLLDVKVNTLTLINILLQKAPEKEHLKKLLKRLDEAGIYAMLERQDGITDPDYLWQLDTFRRTTTEIVPVNNVELSVIRSKMEELHTEIEEKEMELETFKRREVQVALLKKELLRLRSIATRAHYSGHLIQSYSPFQRADASGAEEKKAAGSGHQQQVVSAVELEELESILDTTRVDALQAKFHEVSAQSEKMEKELVQAKEELEESRVSSFETHAALTAKQNEVEVELAARKKAEADLVALQAEVQRLEKELAEKPTVVAPAPAPVAVSPEQESKGGSSQSDEALKKQIEELTEKVRLLELEKKNQSSGAAPSSDAPPPPPAPAIPGAPPAPAVPGAPPAPAIPGAPPAPPAPGVPGAPPAPGVPGAPPAPGVPAAPGAPPAPGAPGAPPPPKLGPVVTKKEVKPAKKMKNIFWSRVLISNTPHGEETIWNLLDDTKVDVDQVVELFAAKASASAIAKSTSTASVASSGGSSRPPTRVRVLDDKRHKAIAIMMRQLPNVPILRRALVTLDSKKINRDKLEALRNQLPTDDETKLVESAGAEADLDEPEQLIAMLAKIPSLKMRLKNWYFTMMFEEKVEALSTDFDLVAAGCKDICSDLKFRNLMQTLLSLGNYLNGGTKRGQADGFHLDYLPKFVNTKSIDNSTNLLEFSARLLVAKSTAYRQVTADLQSVSDAAASPDISEMVAKTKMLDQELKQLEQSIGIVEKNPAGREDGYVAFMTDFLDGARKAVSSLKVKADVAEKAYHKTCIYFSDGSEKAKKLKSNELFATLRTFLQQYQQSLPSNAVKAEKQAPTRKHEVGSKIGGGHSRVPSMGGANVMDAIIASVKQRNALKKSSSRRLDTAN